MLSGDFNARTGKGLDFYDISYSVHEEFGDDPVCLANNLINFGMEKNRSSKDCIKNTYGNSLLEMCKNNNLFILNGRVNGDKEGMFTCRQSSVIDYFICNYDLLSFVFNLTVQDFSSLLSDVHSPVTLTLKVDNSVEIENSFDNCTNIDSCKIKKWETEKQAEFLAAIDKQLVTSLENELDLCNLDRNVEIIENDINMFVMKLNSIILESAKTVFGTYPQKRNNRFVDQKNKPWFDNTCWKHRKAYRVAKRKLKKHNTNYNFIEMKKSERSYKKQMNKSIREYRKSFRKKINNLQKCNSKEYW